MRGAQDPGLQPERTALSWTRTAGGMLLNALICLRTGYTSGSLALLGLSCALLVAAALTFGFGRRRSLVLVRHGPQIAADVAAMRWVTAATLLAVVTGLWAIAQQR